MTQEEKFLLLKDLCARLPYGVVVDYKENEYDHRHWKISTLHTPAYSRSGNLINTDFDGWIEYEEYKGCGVSTGSRPFCFGEILPYLRSIHKLTKEELEELEFLTDSDYVDYCNKHYIDYRNLIPKDLALEAPEGMYKEVQQ